MLNRPVILLAALLAAGVAVSVFAADTITQLASGDRQTTACAGLRLDETEVDATTTQLDCVPFPPTATATPVPATATPAPSSGFPMRLAFYYPWFPNAWTQGGVFPFTNYEPTAGYYDSRNLAVIGRHITDMQYGNISGGIASWWGQGHHTDTAIDELLLAADGTGFKWTLYYEPESLGNPDAAAIDAGLDYILANYTGNPAYLRIGGKPAIFVYADGSDACGMATRWKQANAGRFYVVLKVFANYTGCVDQPDNWHQYSPAVAYDRQGSRSVAISPGFWLKGQAVRLARDLARWNTNIRDMVASGANFQLITTWNEWGEGTQIEESTQLGRAYLEALHNNGVVSATATPSPAPSATPGAPTATPVPGSSQVVLAAGDISGCSTSGDTITANMVLAENPDPAAVLALGDLVYNEGSTAQFNDCYHPTWGQFKASTKPAPGNHEYLTSGAAGYYNYFGMSSPGYYSYNIGNWHFISLNSNCTPAGGCGSTSPQANWLRSDLAANPAACTVAYWHHPRFTKAQYDDQTSMSALYQILYDNNADIVLAGHDHNYQRYKLLNPSGVVDTVRGIRSWVVGTGGRSHYNSLRIDTRRDAGNGDTFGVLKLTLKDGAYDWQFLPEPGKTFTDSGSGVCH